MKKTYFHGTSADNLQSILEKGFSPDEEKIWNVSENGVYAWSVEKLAEEEGIEDEDEQSKLELAKSRAFDNATCALGASKDCRAVVFQIEYEEEEFQEDYSCDNMNGAFVCYGKISSQSIKAAWISEDFSLVKGWFIGSMMGRDMNNLEFSEVERVAGKFLYNSCEISEYIFGSELTPLEIAD